MAISKDIQLENDDLWYKDGDLQLVASDQVHIKDILRSNKGHYKHSPITGVGVFRLLNSPNTPAFVDSFLHNIKTQLLYDGFGNIKFYSAEGLKNLKIDALRINNTNE